MDNMFNIIITCSDARKKEISKLISGYSGYAIYSYKQDKKLTEFNLNYDCFDTCGSQNNNISFDLFLFHTGDDQYKQVPSNLKIKSIFAFSTTKEPKDVKVDQPHDYKGKIYRSVTRESVSSVFSKENVKEFVQFIEHGCSEEYLPAICKLKEKDPCEELLMTLFILTQGALAVLKPEKIFGGPENSREVAKSFMKDNDVLSTKEIRDDAKKKLALDRLFRPANKPYDSSDSPDLGYYWFDECLHELEQISQPVIDERIDKNGIIRLLQLIRKISSSGDSLAKCINDIGSNQDETNNESEFIKNLLSDVHDELAEKLS